MQKRRLVFLAITAAILAIALVSGALVRLGNVYERIATSGRPFVQAVENYRAVNGLFPTDWDQLVPTYLPVKPPQEWTLNSGAVSCFPGWPSVGISYHFNSGWSVVGEGINRTLNVPGPNPAVTTLTGQMRFAAMLAEYEKRIKRRPSERVWYTDKITFLASENRPESVREESERAAMTFPDWWFPQMVLGEVGGHSIDASVRFASWSDGHPSYVNYWHLARHYRNKGDINEALAVLNKAAACQFEPYPKTSQWLVQRWLLTPPNSATRTEVTT